MNVTVIMNSVRLTSGGNMDPCPFRGVRNRWAVCASRHGLIIMITGYLLRRSEPAWEKECFKSNYPYNKLYSGLLGWLFYSNAFWMS